MNLFLSKWLFYQGPISLKGETKHSIDKEVIIAPRLALCSLPALSSMPFPLSIIIIIRFIIPSPYLCWNWITGGWCWASWHATQYCAVLEVGGWQGLSKNQDNSDKLRAGETWPPEVSTTTQQGGSQGPAHLLWICMYAHISQTLQPS